MSNGGTAWAVRNFSAMCQFFRSRPPPGSLAHQPDQDACSDVTRSKCCHGTFTPQAGVAETGVGVHK